MQELLDHAFLHPERVAANPSAGAPLGGVTQEQLKHIVSQVGGARGRCCGSGMGGALQVPWRNGEN